MKNKLFINSISLVLGCISAIFFSAELSSKEGQSAPTPTLRYAFSVNVVVAKPMEQGQVDGGQRRFIEITGGTVYGPKLQGEVMHGGGDWQTVFSGGFTDILARYFLKLTDGTIVEVTNPGVRVASETVITQLSQGEAVDPSEYYFRTTPTFKVAGEKYSWMTRHVFVARGIRNPNDVIIDYFIVD